VRLLHAGMIMAACQMLERYPKPSETQIRHQLEGNLCRCTGYHNIVKAIEWAAEHMARRSREGGHGSH
jgi:carbon-monoxide dehydrogenase small subunit